MKKNANIFKKQATWEVFVIDEKMKKRLSVPYSTSYTLMTLWGIIGFITYRYYMIERTENLFWFLNLKLLGVYFLVSLIALPIGYFRVRVSIWKFEKANQLDTLNLPKKKIQVMSHIIWPGLIILGNVGVMFISPLPSIGVLLFAFVLGEETFPCLLASIAKERKRKIATDVNFSQKVLYGESANWTEVGDGSEIKNDYRGELNETR